VKLATALLEDLMSIVVPRYFMGVFLRGGGGVSCGVGFFFSLW
jgi:hypothetical protein